MVLTSDSVARILLATAYQKFPDASNQSPRDAFLARASTAAFAEGMSGKGDAVAMVDGLRQAIGERRVLVWSTDAKEQADLGSTTLAGAISQTAVNPTVGVYLNDGTGAKLGYYLHNRVKLTAGRCHTDGRRELDVTIRLRYAAPSKGLPAYVLGQGVPGRRPYALQTNVLVSAPVGGSVVEAVKDGIPVSLMRGEDASHEVGSSTVVLEPRGSAEITVRVLAPASPPGAAVTPELQLTPGVNPWTVAVDSYPSCRPSQ